MKLNLFIIMQELPEYEFESSQYDSEGYFTVSDVHFCTKMTRDMQTGVVYVLDSKLLPERRFVYRLPSVICIGKPPMDWISSKTNILYTKKKVDPQEVYDKVFSVFQKYEKIDSELTKLFDTETDLSFLDRFLPRYISNPFDIVNAAYEPIYQYFPRLDQARLTAVKNIPNYNFYYSGEQRNITNAEIYMHSTDRKYKGILKATTPSLYRMLGTGINMLFQNIYVDNNRVGYMEIIEMVNPIMISDYLILTIIADKLKNWFKINTHVISTEDDIGALIYALLRDKTVASSRASFVLDRKGWNENDEYIMFLVESNLGSLTIPKVDAFIRKLNALTNEIGQTTFDNYLIVICNLTKSKRKREDIIRHLESFDDPGSAIGISVTYSPIQNSVYAFTQTRVVSRIRALRYPNKQIGSLDEIDLDYFLYKCRRKQLIEMLISDNLKKLMAYDKAKGSNLVDLLYIYLDNERNVTKTSELAFLHRNTTMYQLGKIKEIMESDFEDNDERFIMLIQLKILKNNPPDVSELDE